MHCTPISALNDNYIWLLQETPSTPYVYIVDPGEAETILTYLQQQNLQLQGILITHHHADHTAGVDKILSNFDVPVYGASTIHCVTQPVIDNEIVALNYLSQPFTVLAIAGHTLDHTAYYGANALFCGDTLFAAGCGRVFEGTYEQMWKSLKRLADLPEQTKVYCGHEYTLKNLQFAQLVEPENRLINEQIKWVEQQLMLAYCSLPSTLKIEKLTNPFLRCHLNDVIKNVSLYAKKPLSSELEVFTALRHWKNDF